MQARSARRPVGALPGATEAPVPPRALLLLARADGELVAAQLSTQPWEQYLHAHLAALRSGAAVLAVRGDGGGRGAPRDVWRLLERAAPQLVSWSTYFAQGASLRAAVEAGRLDAVSADRAAQALGVAQDMVDAVRVDLGLMASPTAARAS
ncbi:MAG: colicin transporter [Actinobacteria bacterium]|nr:colicin transporter [Actinomycetota bacterium]MCG2802303.1 colicin transporter [Cellulomonas sp.]